MTPTRAYRILWMVAALSLFVLPSAMAQDTTVDDSAITVPPGEEVESTQTTFNSDAMLDKSIVVLQSLDKITARTHKFEVPVGETVKFGTIYILAQACKKAPPIEQPEAAAFLQIWQKKAAPESDKKKTETAMPEITSPASSEWIFSGWMFASSPALSAMDHPVYDVWVLDCIDKQDVKKSEADKEKVPVSKETDTSDKTSQE